MSQQQELLGLLDRFSDCFSDSPGLCDAILHEIPTTADFVPKRLREYRVPENLEEVNRQILQLLDMGFITESNSPMASPIVCVLKKRPDRQPSRLVVLGLGLQSDSSPVF